ncbi:endospore coat-associated protein [Paenibacillus darwinianus]|uniref:Endospore coat-associated protein n=1 Tax=Paenibacillus darwinianus TaxID=1380763 RepID=A0A9W5S2F7_9BACL|nr:endospore coat-associated protein [Paenibacillus darwinianus]EXX91732.1 endospore coat-associated protein [Paenibacillus darwinianus]EXX92449.1 endospore coat-associated protein [Paenibacillus darwinianus]
MTGHITAAKPILAILTIEDDIQLFRGNRSNFADLVLTGQELGFVVYVVTVKQLKLNKTQIAGFTFNSGTQSWHTGLFPLPDIVYNRVPMREDELQPAVRKKIDACLRHPTIRLFNPYFFNKWTLFEWLSLSKSTKPFVPTTRRLMTQIGLKRMLKRHPYLYLKPVSGKAGKGIMSVRLLPEKQRPYRLKLQIKRRSRTYRCKSFSRLWFRIRRQSSGEAYIAQQGIELATAEERQFDLRALIQKNGRGQWDITGIGARVAGTTSITTHVPRGGMIEDPEKLLTGTFGLEQARRLMVAVRNAALMIARQIERGSGCELGEMSMDLGVDKLGGIWFFEANSKPMKFDEPHIRKKSLERLFQYSRYLLKPKPKRGGA